MRAKLERQTLREMARRTGRSSEYIKDALCARTYHHVGVAGTRIARDREDRADQPGRGHGLRVYARARTSARLSVSGTNDRAVGSAGRPRRMKEDEHDGGLDEVIRGPPV